MVFHPRLIHISIIEAAEFGGQAAERPNERKLRCDDVNDTPEAYLSLKREGVLDETLVAAGLVLFPPAWLLYPALGHAAGPAVAAVVAVVTTTASAAAMAPPQAPPRTRRPRCPPG